MKYIRHQARQPNICSSMTKCSNPLSANRLFMFSPTIYVVVTATTACANSKYSRYQFLTEKKHSITRCRGQLTKRQLNLLDI